MNTARMAAGGSLPASPALAVSIENFHELITLTPLEINLTALNIIPEKRSRRCGIA